MIVDSSFAEQYLFICEDFGGKLYFFSHDVRNNSFVGDKQFDCVKTINIVSESRVGGNLFKVYPMNTDLLHFKPMNTG
ncbi:MAG: hypothetical protein IPK10_13010 [Bacteroidetes bacterium]|nr:hypothetical protein [Bacteroidota bacterium]